MPRRAEATWQEVVHLVAAFEALHAAYARSADPERRAMAPSLAAGLRQGQALVAAGPAAPWPAGFRTGLREGARELPYFLAMLPEAERADAVTAVAGAGGMWFVELISATARRAAAALRRGFLRSEDEYRCVREWVDQLEGAAAGDATLAAYYKLLATCEAPGWPAG